MKEGEKKLKGGTYMWIFIVLISDYAVYVPLCTSKENYSKSVYIMDEVRGEKASHKMMPGSLSQKTFLNDPKNMMKMV